MGWCADLGGLLWLHQALHLLRFSQESRPLSLLEEEEATHFIQQEPEVAGRWALPVLVLTAHPGKAGGPLLLDPSGPQAGEEREPAGVWAFPSMSTTSRKGMPALAAPWPPLQ